MKTITLTDKMKSITIGRQGENKSTKVIIDLSSWLDYFGEVGTFSLWHQRCHEETKYPVAIIQSSGVIEWDVTSTDTAIVGVGKCEIVYTIDEVVMKSKTVDAIVEKSLTGEETSCPDPYQSWVNDVLSAADNIDEVVTQTREHSESASASAAIAEESARIASEASSSVQENTDLAREAAADAQAHSNLAMAYAEQALSSKNDAVTAGSNAEASAIAAAEYEAIASHASEETREKVDEMREFIDGDVKEYLEDALRETRDHTDDVFTRIKDALALFTDDVESLVRREYELNDVNFIDYDGKIIASYSLEEVGQLETLPTPPKHKDLVFSGWNYAFESIKQLTHKADIGAIYSTEDGYTHLKIKVRSKSRSNVPICYTQTIANGVSVDWGDGSILSSSESVGRVMLTHSYSQPGDYTIKMRVADGCTLGFGYSEEPYCMFGPSATTEPGARAYLDCITELHIGDGVTEINSYAFQNCPSLTYITIPEGTVMVKENAFEYCYHLETLILPMSCTTVGRYAFQYCNGLKTVIGAEGGETIYENAFSNCYDLRRVSLADSSKIRSGVFKSCESLPSIRIPNGMTVIEDSTFNNCYSLNDIQFPDVMDQIGSYAFNNCVSLAEVKLPQVSRIMAYAFFGCYGIGGIYLTNTTPPFLSSSNAFSYNANDRKFIVPVDCARAYKENSAWSAFANNIIEE